MQTIAESISIGVAATFPDMDTRINRTQLLVDTLLWVTSGLECPDADSDQVKALAMIAELANKLSPQPEAAA